MDQHKLISAVRDLAIELGRTPTRAEFEAKVRGGKYQLGKLFGDQFTILLQAAELEPSENSRVRITNAVFQRDIKSVIESHKPRPREEIPDRKSMAIISDIHWPFHSQRVIDRFFRYVDDNKPDVVIIDGDAMDMYSHAKFPRSHNVFTPKDEEILARKLNEDFWLEIKRLSPKSECIQMLGNHDVRPLKRTIEAQPSIEHWVEKIMGELFSFAGVRTVMDPREEIFIGDVMIHHGHLSRLGAHRDHALYNVIVGHTHKAGIVYRNIRGKTLFEMNCGYAGDPESKGLSYTPQKITGWTPGFGAVDDDGARVVIV